MKKIIVSSLVLTGALFAATNEEILALYSNLPQDIKIEIANRQPVKDTNGIDMVTLKITQGDMAQEDILFTKDSFLMPDIIDIKTGTSYKTIAKQAQVEKKLSEIYPKESKDNIIKLGNNSKNPTYIIFTDADCPYCRQEMSMIEERLKNANIEIVMTSVHGPKSNAKSYLIYEETKKAKTDEDKIKILKKYYDENLNIEDGKVSLQNIAKAEAIAKKYQAAGVSGVPFIIEKSKIVKN